jgi:hypothetical protein
MGLGMSRDWAFQKRLIKSLEKFNSPVTLIKSQKDLQRSEERTSLFRISGSSSLQKLAQTDPMECTLECKIQCSFPRSWPDTNNASTCQAIKHDDASFN